MKAATSCASWSVRLPGFRVRHGVPNNAGERIDACGARAIVPRARSPQRTGFLVADGDALAVGAVTRGAALEKNRFAFLRIELGDGNQRSRGDGVLPPPWRILPDRRSFGEPRNVGRNREHFLRRRRGQFVAHDGVGRFRIERAGRILTPPETIDDAIVQAVKRPERRLYSGNIAAMATIGSERSRCPALRWQLAHVILPGTNCLASAGVFVKSL